MRALLFRTILFLGFSVSSQAAISSLAYHNLPLFPNDFGTGFEEGDRLSFSFSFDDSQVGTVSNQDDTWGYFRVIPLVANDVSLQIHRGENLIYEILPQNNVYMYLSYVEFFGWEKRSGIGLYLGESIVPDFLAPNGELAPLSRWTFTIIDAQSITSTFEDGSLDRGFGTPLFTAAPEEGETYVLGEILGSSGFSPEYLQASASSYDSFSLAIPEISISAMMTAFVGGLSLRRKRTCFR